MIRQQPPHGYTTAPWDNLGMHRSNFYQTGLNTLWSKGEFDAFQVAPNTPILYDKEDVGKLRYWLTARQGYIALGKLPGNAPLLPNFGLTAWFDEGHDDADCPVCSGGAIADWESGRVWCPEHGIQSID